MPATSTGQVSVSAGRESRSITLRSEMSWKTAVKKRESSVRASQIENSTSIYSGLLRFADLNIIAPNTLYPMFIVAPQERKNRLRDQLRRPTFKRLELDKKVRFLSYEAIDDIDDFFASSNAGLNVDIILAKSEQAG